MAEVLPQIRVLNDRYSAWLCDVWGVLHNGVTPYVPAVEALTAFRAGGGRVVMITNAPRPATSVAAQFTGLGVPDETYDAIVTSGDSTRFWLRQLGAETVFHLGPERDLPLFADLDLNLVGAGTTPDVVLCTGLFDDETESPDDYAERLAAYRRDGVMLMCANPDIVVHRGGKEVYCAGAIARAYEAIGGQVTYAGKPHKPIYDLAFERLKEITGSRVPASSVLAIGDGMPTDIAGAQAMGLASVFIAGGIHAADVAETPRQIDEDRLVAFLQSRNAEPVAVQWELAW